jgi:hypothetical protein
MIYKFHDTFFMNDQDIKLSSFQVVIFKFLSTLSTIKLSSLDFDTILGRELELVQYWTA